MGNYSDAFFVNWFDCFGGFFGDRKVFCLTYDYMTYTYCKSLVWGCTVVFFTLTVAHLSNLTGLAYIIVLQIHLYTLKP